MERKIHLFTKTEYVKPTFPPKPGRPLCYEQMSKLRFSWWASWSEHDERGYLVSKETGPFPSYAAACRFAGR